MEERADKFYEDFATDLSVEPDITRRVLSVSNCGKEHQVLLKQGTLHMTHVDWVQISTFKWYGLAF